MNSTPTPESILQQIAQIQHMEKGSLHVIGQGPSGPYHNLQFIENGRHVSRYIPQEQLNQVCLAVEGYHQFDRLSDQYAQLIIERTRAEIGGSKKKRPTSPSLRKKKSPN
jgi:hypothetical protein